MTSSSIILIVIGVIALASAFIAYYYGYDKPIENPDDFDDELNSADDEDK